MIPVRRGVTLIEILVLIAVIGVLAGLVVPAVLSAREAGRRLQCLTNLKQIGLALANYEGVKGVYPFGSGSGGPAEWPSRWSAQSQLLPYLEQGTVFDAINFSGVPWLHDPVSAPPNQTALSTRIAVFLCPSDRDGIAEQYGLGHNNYRATAGVQPVNLAAGSPDAKGSNDGVFWYLSSIRQSDITDGTAGTAMFSERGLGNSRTFDVVGDIYTLAGAPFAACDQVNPAVTPRFASPVELSGQRWGDGNAFYTRYQHHLPPNHASCMFSVEDYDGPAIITATSRHAGGVNVLLGDGSVRFVRESIALGTWRAMATRAGAETISANDF